MSRRPMTIKKSPRMVESTVIKARHIDPRKLDEDRDMMAEGGMLEEEHHDREEIERLQSPHKEDMTANSERRASPDDKHHDSEEISLNSRKHKDDPQSDLHPMDDMDQFDHIDEEEEKIDRQASIASAIMAKRRRMADGGEVDLSRNADEDANLEDQLSFEALKKENYRESEGLEELTSPMDSNLHGDDAEEHDENVHDKSITDAIRRRMKSKSPIVR